MPKWIAITYDLEKELDLFVGDYIWRKSFSEPNYWITKPISLTKSIDMTVSNNLDLILRMSQTGPKIVCKYVENPLRYRGVKFDFRLYTVVRSVARAA
jgi:tubulin--tyrosine ligase-like protein 12